MDALRTLSCSKAISAGCLGLAMLCAASALRAQKAAIVTGGIISGHVVFADNDRPARFATVYLKPVAPAPGEDDFFTVLMDSSIANMQTKSGGGNTSEDAAELKSARDATHGLMQDVSDAMLSATVSADGVYVFTGVTPGSYYVHVKAPGYVDPLAAFSSTDLASSDPDLRRKIAAAVPIVAVSGPEQVREDLRLERGAVLTGRVLYDDGSPAVGWTVHALGSADAAATPTNIFGIDLTQLRVGRNADRITTDDTGRFRISGLPGGTYILEARMTTASLDQTPFTPVESSQGSFLSILGGLSGNSGLRLTVYSGNATHKSAAKAFDVHAGEERGGNDILVPLHATRSVSGLVLAKADGHTVNDGSVELIAQDADGHDDTSLQLSATVHEDGSFRFDYVPAPGTYTLRARHARDSTQVSTMKLLGSLIAERATRHTYGRSSMTLTLDDKDAADIRLMVSEPTSAAAALR